MNGSTWVSELPKKANTSSVGVISTGGLAKWVRDTIPDLLGLTALEDNWDSYGSRAPSLDLVQFVVYLLHQTEIMELPVPTVVPMPSGGIQLEWATGGCELEISFYPDGRASVLRTTPAGDVLEESEFVVTDFAAARRVLCPIAQ